MIITEAMNISAGSRNHNNSLCVFHDAFIPGLSAIVSAIHDNGAPVVGQLNHRGQLLAPLRARHGAGRPSAGHHPATGERVRALGSRASTAIQRDFLDCGGRLWRAGYDGVEVHAANGYLFHQFFSPRFNRRDGRTTADGRESDALPARDRRPSSRWSSLVSVLVRVSATEFVEGGYPEADMVALVQALERAGVAAIDLSGGTNETPALSRFCIQPPSFPRRGARAVRTAAQGGGEDPGDHGGPYHRAGGGRGGAAGRQRRFHRARARPARRSALVGQSVRRDRRADPLLHFVQRVLRALVGRTRRDVRAESAARHRIRDARPPRAATRRPAATRLRMPARCWSSAPALRGLEAARVAAGLGHTVEVWECTGEAGGQMPLALAGTDKSEVSGVWTATAPRRSSGCACRQSFAVAVSAAAIQRFAPDMVFVATGADAARSAARASTSRFPCCRRGPSC